MGVVSPSYQSLTSPLLTEISGNAGFVSSLSQAARLTAIPAKAAQNNFQSIIYSWLIVTYTYSYSFFRHIFPEFARWEPHLFPTGLNPPSILRFSKGQIGYKYNELSVIHTALEPGDENFSQPYNNYPHIRIYTKVFKD